MGNKSSKNAQVDVPPLGRRSIEELCRDTGFSEEELLIWHRNFYNDCPDGKLTLKQFEHAYAKIMGKPTQKTANYVKHMFSVYDQDKNQYIDFREFVMALSAASVVNRLRLIETLFHVFDLDNDGKITKDEIGKMLHTLVDVTNSNDKRHNRRNQQKSNDSDRTKKDDLRQRIDDAFNELNANDDDHITKDEFIEWYMKSGLISDVQNNELDASNSSQRHEIEKKSRKLMKQSSYIQPRNENENVSNRNTSALRHLPRMIERKPQKHYHDDDNNDDYDNNNNDQRTTMRPLRNSKNKHVIEVVDDNNDDDDVEGRVTSRGALQWQRIFNSVLGQVRQQHDQEIRGHSNGDQQTEQTKFGHRKQKTKTTNRNDNQSFELETSTKVSKEQPPSPDVITVRF